jgi:lysozyme
MRITVGENSYDLADLPPEALKQLGIPVEEYDPFARFFPPGAIHRPYKPAPIVLESDLLLLSREQLTRVWRDAVAKKERLLAFVASIDRRRTALSASARNPTPGVEVNAAAGVSGAESQPAEPADAIKPSLGSATTEPSSRPSTQPATTQPSSRPSWDVAPYLTLIERHEGRRYTVYTDTKGNPTIGVGFNLNRANADRTLNRLAPGLTRDDLLNGQPLTDEQIDTLLRNDTTKALSSARAQLPNFDNLSSSAQKAVVDMVFNLGPSGFSKFRHLKAALAKEDYTQAAQEMINSKWYNEVGNRGKDDVQFMQDAASGQ